MISYILMRDDIWGIILWQKDHILGCLEGQSITISNE